VFIYEAQDLSPSALRFLAGLCYEGKDSTKRLYIAADSNQTIYGIGQAIAWSEIHPGLGYPANIRNFNVNYRSTLQILRGAETYLTGSELEEEKVDVKHMRKGPKPKARLVDDFETELTQIESFVRSSTQRFQTGLDVCAVLVPSWQKGRSVALGLLSRGMNATFMASEEVDLSLSGIKVLNLHSAKGLEFSIVTVALGDREEISDSESPEEYAQQCRLIHMAMTRATRSLLVTLPIDSKMQQLHGISAPNWDVRAVKVDITPF